MRHWERVFSFRESTFNQTRPRSFGVPDKSNKKVCFDGFELDYGRFQLSRSGSPLRLEGLPLQLLMFMVENRGQLVTREQISSELWSKDVFVDVEQGINTAVRKIRRALDDDADHPQYLQTVVGRGYRFVAPTAEEVTTDRGSSEKFAVSAEELGRAIMTAAGLDPENPRGTPEPSEE
jgi:DNA-binding winged helix-turn-helix (wHTH) protein